jgi:hypothetical protein
MAWPTGAQAVGGMAVSQDGALYVTADGGSFADATLSNPTITGTATVTQVSGIERVVAKWGVPVILASSGTMGNNGAVSAMTALPLTYSGGAWLYLPANAIQAGSSAGFYWFVASSTTAGTVYNSTFDGLSVPAPGTTTAFVSTGPGAFTGIAAGEIVAATVAIGAGDIGPSGVLTVEAEATNNTAAGNKTFRMDLGGTDVFSVVLSTTMGGSAWARIRNRGSAAVQVANGALQQGSGFSQSAIVAGAVNTANAASLALTLEKATATNHAIWEGGTVKIAYGS